LYYFLNLYKMEGIKLNVNDLYLNALLPQIEKILEKE
jgi:hypothetical protein